MTMTIEQWNTTLDDMLAYLLMLDERDRQVQATTVVDASNVFNARILKDEIMEDPNTPDGCGTGVLNWTWVDVNWTPHRSMCKW